jgi:hypothetical protein
MHELLSLSFESLYPAALLAVAAGAVTLSRTRILRWWTAHQRRRAAEADRRHQAAVAAALAAEEAVERKQLADERVGALFRRRSTREDTGTIVRIVALDDRHWRTKVRIVETFPSGRTPTAYDTDGVPATIEWRHLTEAPAEQRRRNARVVVGSHDPEDGWVTYERIG